ncbi:MAG TPA: hypothetical protein VFA16_15350, partial [Mycobacterium sp.]|uniref:hypothetical protein n=1 Tax=Mycobacterium sp. TaxID=1785 RepID=UPI002D3933A1
RALSAIQAEGFRAASRIVDRFVRAVGPDVTDGDGHAANVNASNDGQAGMPEWERLARAWWSMVGQFLLSSTSFAAHRGSATVALDVNDPDTKGALNLEAPVGGSASAEVWLHNRGPDDRADVRLRCSDLLSHEGDVIDAAAVVIDTAVVAMPRRSSRGVTIRIDVAPQTRPGVYRGTVLASGHPDLWLPVRLTVRLPST